MFSVFNTTSDVSRRPFEDFLSIINLFKTVKIIKLIGAVTLIREEKISENEYFTREISHTMIS